MIQVLELRLFHTLRENNTVKLIILIEEESQKYVPGEQDGII